MKKPIIASNWKLYKNREEALDFLEQLAAGVDAEDLSENFLFFPPAMHIGIFSLVDFGSDFNFGPQNIYSQIEGAFTGENSVTTAKSYGAKYALVGHSERRQLFAETNETCNQKLKLCLSEEVTPVYCIGETLAERQANKTLNVLEEQLEKGLAQLQIKPKNIMIAYEPVWAIGTGKVATSTQAGEAHDFVRSWLTKKFGETTAKSTPILYGGSVKPENSAELSEQKNIDGFLIGSASLKVESLIGIYQNAQS